MNSYFGAGPPVWDPAAQGPRPTARATVRTVRQVLEDALVDSFSRVALDTMLPDELGLMWAGEVDDPRDQSLSKREAIRGYTSGWALPQLVGLAQRVTAELDLPENWRSELLRYVDAYERGGGVRGMSKNLIFAANGPKPELVLRDAVNNDIEIVENAEYCLVYDQPIPTEGLRLSHLIGWWRRRERIPDTTSDRDVALALHSRLRQSMTENPAELVVFDTYAARYKDAFDIPALIPQVYLHFDPLTQRTRRASANGSPLARQRMDFLLLYSSSQRVVIEVDGKQHYSDDSNASPARYAEMVAEDRRLRLLGYEVYRFGGYELTQKPDASKMVRKFFDQLAERMR